MSFNANIPATAAVYQSTRQRRHNLRDTRKYRHDPTELLMSPELARQLHQHCLPFSNIPSRLADMDGDTLIRELLLAQAWLFNFLDCHKVFFTREMEIRMFRSAIEKRQSDWTEKQVLYMALSEGGPPLERFNAGLAIVVHFDLARRLKDIGELAKVKADQMRRAKSKDDELDEIREMIVAKTENILIDDFVCAVPLQEIRKATSSVIDDNAGCCPICQNSYTDLSNGSIHDLLSDYPVRIKYCGHIFGKGCLEQWMLTPKIDAARHPFKKCPTCRVQIEGLDVGGAAMTFNPPSQLLEHLKSNARALATIRYLVENFGLDMQECMDVVRQAMSDEIAAEQLLAELSTQPTRYETEKEFLKIKLEEVTRQRWAWGFRSDGLWRSLRDEWMASGQKA